MRSARVHAIKLVPLSTQVFGSICRSATILEDARSVGTTNSIQDFYWLSHCQRTVSAQAEARAKGAVAQGVVVSVDAVGQDRRKVRAK